MTREKLQGHGLGRGGRQGQAEEGQDVPDLHRAEYEKKVVQCREL